MKMRNTVSHFFSLRDKENKGWYKITLWWVWFLIFLCFSACTKDKAQEDEYKDELKDVLTTSYDGMETNLRIEGDSLYVKQINTSDKTAFIMPILLRANWEDYGQITQYDEDTNTSYGTNNDGTPPTALSAYGLHIPANRTQLLAYHLNDLRTNHWKQLLIQGDTIRFAAWFQKEWEPAVWPNDTRAQGFIIVPEY